MSWHFDVFEDKAYLYNDCYSRHEMDAFAYFGCCGDKNFSSFTGEVFPERRNIDVFRVLCAHALKKSPEKFMQSTVEQRDYVGFNSLLQKAGVGYDGCYPPGRLFYKDKDDGYEKPAEQENREAVQAIFQQPDPLTHILPPNFFMLKTWRGHKAAFDATMKHIDPSLQTAKLKEIQTCLEQESAQTTETPKTRILSPQAPQAKISPLAQKTRALISGDICWGMLREKGVGTAVR